MTLSQRSLRFIDIETTGLDPARHEILSVAVVDIEGRVLLDTAVAPEHSETAHPQALEVNGYTPEAWAGAPPMANVAPKIQELLSKPTLIVGHNVAFDVSFLTAALHRAGVPPRFDYHVIDTVTLAYAVLGAPGHVESLSLAPVCEALGISNEGAHTALADAQRCREVWLALRERLQRTAYQDGAEGNACNPTQVP